MMPQIRHADPRCPWGSRESNVRLLVALIRTVRPLATRWTAIACWRSTPGPRLGSSTCFPAAGAGEIRPVGLEPVAVAVRNNTSWVVNHL